MPCLPVAPPDRLESMSVSTLVFLHAHPDDECLITGGTIARAAAEGHRVVLVVATNGDHGEVPEDLAPGEDLVARRRAETEESARVLGVERIVWLGYRDSGMTGWDQNADPENFMNASVDDAATRLAAVLVEESADLLVGYDWHGGYGHPDHIAVHKVARRAAEMQPAVRLLEATMNRDRFRESLALARAAGMDDDGWDPDGPADDGNPMGSLESEISLGVDVLAHLAVKREAVRAHASQVSDTSSILSIPEEAFAFVFGTEWFIDPADESPMRMGWILP